VEQLNDAEDIARHNVHFKAHEVYIDGMHNSAAHYGNQRRYPFIIEAQFTKLDGTLFTGSQLYSFAIPWSDTGFKNTIDLRNGGYTLSGNLGPPNTGSYAGGGLRD
jgi:hypothetical protein